MSRSPSETEKVSPIRSAQDFAMAFKVSRETLERLEIYAGLLALWQKTINLVAPGTLNDVWSRHLADSAQILQHAPRSGHWVDLGSGAGFPGLVVAILRADPAFQVADAADLSPAQRRVTLIESDSRKCAFLAEVVRKTALQPQVPVEILCARIENASTRDKLTLVQVVSARALASLDRLLGLARPLFGPDTVGLFLKGREHEAEIGEARRRWHFEAKVWPSMTDASGRVVEIRRLEAKTED